MPVTHKSWLWLLTLSYLLLIILKAPSLFIEPRFWAEDGIIYYLQARHLPAWQALWAMPLGYLSLPPNLAGVLAVQLPLKYAPYASLLISLTIQILLLAVVLVNGYFTQQRLAQCLLLLVPMAVVASTETWLNPINSQVWLAICAALILAAPQQQLNLKQHLFNASVLLLASLSGVVAAFITPLFILRAFIERRWTWLIYAGLLAIGAGLVVLSDNPVKRSLDFPLDLFAVRSFLQLLLNNWCLPCSNWLVSQPKLLHSDFLALACLLLVFLTYSVLWHYTKSTGRWLLLASISLLILSFAGALGKEQLADLPAFFSARYFFAPASLLIMSLLFIRCAWRGLSLTLLFTVFLANGIWVSLSLGVVGQYDGKGWRTSVSAYEQGQSSVVYFSTPFCAFSPNQTASTSTPAYTLEKTATTIRIKIADLAQIQQPQIYLYRSSTARPGIFQAYQQTWEDTQLFFAGSQQYGQCYGGLAAKPSLGTRLEGADTLILDRAMLADVQGHQYLLGYGENLASLLAQRHFLTLDGANLE